MKKLIVLILIVASCSIIPQDAGIWTGFTIKEGNHWATPYELRSRINDDTISIRFKFHQDTYYDDLGPGLEGDWNKLGYITENVDPHKSNSVTITWKWIEYQGERRLIIGWYGWQDGVSPQENTDFKGFIGVIEPDVFYDAQIILGDLVTVVIDGDEHPTPLKCAGGYILPPYFGGQAKAPHDMNITIIYDIDYD